MSSSKSPAVLFLLLLFFIASVHADCSAIECLACIEDTADECVWCADNAGACVHVNSTEARACSSVPEDSFQQCPPLEKRDASILRDVFVALREDTPAENPWFAYLSDMIDDVAHFKCPRLPPRPTPHSGWSCVRGALWTFALDPAGLPRVGTRTSQIVGSLHPSIANLTELRTLSIKDHMLAGTVPSLSRMSRLTHLTLNANQLSGAFPDVDRLSNLEEIWINTNKFSGPLPKLPLTTTLKVVHFEDNRFTGQLPDLSNLTSLIVFNADRNQLSGIPPATAPQLKVCSLGSAVDDDNCFQAATCSSACSCPANVVDCRLRLSDRNALAAVLQSLAANSGGQYNFSVHLDELQRRVCPTGAPVNGIVEQSFVCIGGRLTTLKLVGAGADHWEKEVPIELLLLDALEDIRLPGLSLSGTFPNLQAMTALTYLDLSDNYLLSPLEVAGAAKLEHLSIGLNRFRTMPDLYLLPALKSFEGQQNFFTNDVDLPEFATFTHCVLGAPAREGNCFPNAKCPGVCVCPPNVLSCGGNTTVDVEPRTNPSPPASTAAQHPREGQQLSDGAVAGYACLGVALLLTIAAIIFCLYRQRNNGFRKFSSSGEGRE